MSTPEATTTIPRFAAGEKGAATAALIFALLSTLVLSFVLFRAVWVVSSVSFKRTAFHDLSREAFFFRSQLGQYAGCLLLGNWIRGISGLIDIKWVNAGGVKAGSSCTTQGSLRQIGQFGSFFFTVAMGIHTFNTLVLRNRQPQWLGIVVTFVGWASAIAIGLAPLTTSSRAGGSIYNVDGFTCGMSKSHQVSHMLLYFLPLFLAAILSAIVYSLVFLMLRGTLVINGGLRIHICPERRLRLCSGSFEEYQRFMYSVAQTMLWLPISFVLSFLPSSIVQLMDISGITVSPGVTAFSYILEHIDGVINVLIIFNVLRALRLAMKSTLILNIEEQCSERCSISRPKYDWKPQSMFASIIQGPVMKTAPPAYPPDTIVHWSVSQAKSHKKTWSANSVTRLLASEPPTHSRSPSPNFERSGLSSSMPIARTSVVDAELNVPPRAIRRHAPMVPPLDFLTLELLPQHSSNSMALTPSPRGKRWRVSRDLNPTLGSPTTTSLPSSAPFLEVTLHSPRASVTLDGASSLISMYLSRKSSTTSELPPFPAAAVQRDSAVELPVAVPPESVGIGLPLKATVSIGAVGGHVRPSAAHPELPPPPSTSSPADSTNPSQYSESEGDSPSPPPQVRPLQPKHISKATGMKAQPRASRDRQSSERSHSIQGRFAPRGPPTPLGWPIPPRTPSARARSHTSTLASPSSHSYKGSSSLPHYEYV